MALMKKKISDLLVEIRDTLQDQQKTRWTDQELYRYLEQANRDIALRIKPTNTKHIISVGDPLVSTFPLPYEIIEVFEIHSQQPYKIIDATEIEFPLKHTEEVLVDYYGYPTRIVYGVTLEIEIEQDLADGLRFYALNRAYQKESSEENIRKAGYFFDEYLKVLSRNPSRWDNFDQPIDRQDYYI